MSLRIYDLWYLLQFNKFIKDFNNLLILLPLLLLLLLYCHTKVKQISISIKNYSKFEELHYMLICKQIKKKTENG